MLKISKIFHFEMAHAIYGYEGLCKNIHGHSYELHVTVTTENECDDYIPEPGFMIDFKVVKSVVSESIIKKMDHKLLLSESFLKINQGLKTQENLIVWSVEPSAENILIYIKQILEKKFTENIILSELKLYETKDSYAQWTK